MKSKRRIQMKDHATRRFAASLFAGLTLLSFPPAGWLRAEPAAPYAPYVPADKKLDPKWVESLSPPELRIAWSL